MIDGMTDDQLRAEAMAIRDAHDPALQPDNGYQRCALCHYTRHPCDGYDQATTILELLDRKDPVADEVRALANRWAYKFTLLAQWVKANCTPEQAREAQAYAAAESGL